MISRMCLMMCLMMCLLISRMCLMMCYLMCLMMCLRMCHMCPIMSHVLKLRLFRRSENETIELVHVTMIFFSYFLPPPSFLIVASHS